MARPQKRTFPIINRLGGRYAVASILRAHGVKASTDGVRMWSAANRGVIPGDATRELMQEAERLGLRYDAKDFYVVECES